MHQIREIVSVLKGPVPGRFGMALRQTAGFGVTADGACDTRKCHDAIADDGANAIIPLRKNAKPRKSVAASAVARNEALRAAKYLGRAIWRNWSGYHRRSRVETKMPCMKPMRQRLTARDFDPWVAEVQVRVAVMNRDTARRFPVTKAVG